MLKVLNLASKNYTHFIIKICRKTCSLKCLHSVDQELKLPAVPLHTDCNSSKFGPFCFMRMDDTFVSPFWR